MKSDSELKSNDKVTVHLLDSTCEGFFVCEDTLGMTVFKNVENGILYMLIPWQNIQWIEWIKES